MTDKKTVLLTGATGTMGSATLLELLRLSDPPRIRVLARPGKKNHKALDPLIAEGSVEVVWGDLTSRTDIRRAVDAADIILHIGGMVSPKADHNPRATWSVNVGSMRMIVEEICRRPDADKVTVVYIGSVAQYGPRLAPRLWGRAGDPMIAAIDDVYALSKIAAERILAESGLRRWVSLRQTAILAPELLFKGSDPISFHVPLQGVIEWVTAEQSGRLLAGLCVADLPDTFYRHFYNIGGGKSFRLTNYRFESQLMKAISCPPPEKVFETRWFAVRNFHGLWFADSDDLELLIPFRGDGNAEEYFHEMARRLPFYFRLAGIVPASLIKWGMKQVALKKPLGTLTWENGADPERTTAFFGSQEQRDRIPDWPSLDLSTPSTTTPSPSASSTIPSSASVSLSSSSFSSFVSSSASTVLRAMPEKNTPSILSHGYDESRPESSLGIDDMRMAAAFRGGKCLSESMTVGDLDTPLEWECAFGHRFHARPATVLLGGHWCPGCFPMPENASVATSPRWNYDEESRRNPFLAQAWLSTHSPEENNPHTGIPLPPLC